MFGDALILNSFVGAGFVTLLMYLDFYEKEKIIFVAKIFYFSIIATALYVVLKYFLFNFNRENLFFETVVFAPITEEMLKFGLLYYFFSKWPNEINESFDMIVYIGIIALGFSIYENVGYYMKYTQNVSFHFILSENPTYYLRALREIFIIRLLPAHLLIDSSAIIFAGFGYKYGKMKMRIFISFLIAVLLHFGWNFLAVKSINILRIYSFVLIVSTVLSVYFLLKISQFRNTTKFDVDEYGVSKKERYDWKYYLMFYVFIVIVGVLGILSASLLELLL